MGFICFPTSGVEGVAALYEAFHGGWGYLEGQKKCCCCILAWTKITLSVQHNFLLNTVLENDRKCLEIMKRVC